MGQAGIEARQQDCRGMPLADSLTDAYMLAPCRDSFEKAARSR